MTTEIFQRYPAPDEAVLDLELGEAIRGSGVKFVVLDDDPTGIQTVHDVSVFTGWDEASVREGFLEEGNVFYILTNSRGMTREETTRVHREIIDTVLRISGETGKPCQVISRSDSTLRGHYPLETEILREGIEADGKKVDGEILAPYFREGGRFTIGNIHYVRYGEELVPAAETEFARDVTFGYRHSSIPEYVEEKTGGRYKAEDVICIPLEDLRAERIDAVAALLTAAEDFQKICVNAISDCDLKVFGIALYRALAAGKTFLCRTAAGFVKVICGITDRPLLTGAEMLGASGSPGSAAGGRRGGIIVVGSHTAKTTAQLEVLLTLPGTAGIPFRSSAVLDGGEAFDAEVARCVALAENAVRDGRTAVCFTERKLLTLPDDTRETALLRSVKISDGVQRLVAGLSVRPAFVIAKGGITSADVGVKALGVRKATVLGQICPGIPVWRTGSESRFPGIPYVIFPGNVGGPETLREAAEKLMRA